MTTSSSSTTRSGRSCPSTSSVRSIEPVACGAADSTDTVIPSADTLVIVEAIGSSRSPTGPATGAARRHRPSARASSPRRTRRRPRRATSAPRTTAAWSCGTCPACASWPWPATRSTSRSRPGSTSSWPTGCSRCGRSRRPTNPAPADPLEGARLYVVGGTNGIGRASRTRRGARGRRSRSTAGRSASTSATTRRVAGHVDAAAARMGGLDHVVVTAGVLRIGRVMATEPAELAEVIDVNLTGTLNVARAAYPHLCASRGSLTVFASSSFTRGRPDYVAYSASKAAVVNLAQGLAEEWCDDGVRVNAVSPERTDTPMRRRAFPEESRSGMLSTEEVADGHPAADRLGPDRPGLRHQAPRHAPDRPVGRAGAGGDGPPLNRLEYLLSSVVLRLLGLAFSILPIRRRRVVLATARVASLEGNLAHLYAAMRASQPDREYVLLLEPYSYGLLGKVAYLGRLIRGMYHLRTAGLFIVDNAYLPIHVAPHRSGTTVVQVWHAVGALKRFGADTLRPLAEPERTFLHRHYDYVVTTSESRSRAVLGRAPDADRARPAPWGRRGRTSSSTSRRWRPRGPACWTRIRSWPGDGSSSTLRRSAGGDPPNGPAAGSMRSACARSLPEDHALVLKTHPNLDPGGDAEGRLRRRREPGVGDERLAGPRRRPRHRLLVVDLRVRAPAAAADPARPRPRGVRARPGALSRLPDRDDRDAGRPTPTASSTRSLADASTPRGTTRSSPDTSRRMARPAADSSSVSWRAARKRRGDTLRRDVRHL